MRLNKMYPNLQKNWSKFAKDIDLKPFCPKLITDISLNIEVVKTKQKKALADFKVPIKGYPLYPKFKPRHIFELFTYSKTQTKKHNFLPNRNPNQHAFLRN